MPFYSWRPLNFFFGKKIQEIITSDTLPGKILKYFVAQT
uniref:Uncharacterized protein n=1 Tax=Arundo donax TaxID=35708 RepID=A0A0A9B224_ARUDO